MVSWERKVRLRVPSMTGSSGETAPIYFVNSSTLMHRETVLAMGGYREAFAPAEDVDLWIRMAEQGHLMLKIPEPLLLYRMHGASLTMTQNARQRLLHRWAIACGEARVKGLTEPSYGEFVAEEKRRPPMERARIFRRETGERLYQQAALYYAEQRPACNDPEFARCGRHAPGSCHPAALRPEDRAPPERQAAARHDCRHKPGPGKGGVSPCARKMNLLLSLCPKCIPKGTKPVADLAGVMSTGTVCQSLRVAQCGSACLQGPSCRPVAGAVPPAAMNRMRSLHHNNTARSLFLASELSRILHASSRPASRHTPSRGLPCP